MHRGDTVLLQEKTGEQSSKKSHRTPLLWYTCQGSKPDLLITTEDKPNSILYI